MHFTSSLFTLSSIFGAALADCNHDNCLRAVIASAFPTRNVASDCSSYMAITVTPATKTITVTNTHTTYTATTDLPVGGTNKRRVKGRAPNNGLEVRQATVSPTNIPAYASACSGAVRYSSACSCIGVPATTITVATPSTTTTVQATVSLIRQAPAVVMNNYLDEQCGVLNPDFPQMTVYADGTCYNVFESLSNIDVQFSPGNCGVTASQCTVNLYSQIGCGGTPSESFPASSNVCFDTFVIYGATLVCPTC